MSFSAPQSSPKRPRLSLQIKAPATAVAFGKSSTVVKADVDPSSPTAFNTLSNAYAAAIENNSPRTAKPPVIDFKPSKPTSLRLETRSFDSDGAYVHPNRRTHTPGPFTITYPDTPSSALAGQTPVSGRGEHKASAAAFTFTPPQSAGAGEQLLPHVFTFDANVPNKDAPSTPRVSRRRPTQSSNGQPPYTHPRSLRSILRNSPLPPPSTIAPLAPSRSSLRIATSKSYKKVGYNDPLTQTITTNKYIKSHIELLAEDSPYSATPPTAETESLDLVLSHTANETRDGGQTPGPFEEMRRRMADSDLETPGAKKRKRKEKKRKWEWTITNTDEDGLVTPQEQPNKTPMTEFKVGIPIPPSPAVEREASVSTDSEMSEAEERFVPPTADVNETATSTDSEMSEEDGSRPGTSQSL
ncbi:hypothetical protein BJ875DRAFT_381042 [Amylocarpus encephaloides]|uniref:Uncharacterized protein n=1 Tax=Amylocarpus encephaloides TaxID=45428 RepID=A0A9P7YF25_9HELO|nr:hypothetical protein BJ875DRAFT_381042 [Amylocarpus encephaloides]